jgi:hypothetical protein
MLHRPVHTTCYTNEQHSFSAFFLSPLRHCAGFNSSPFPFSSSRMAFALHSGSLSGRPGYLLQSDDRVSWLDSALAYRLNTAVQCPIFSTASWIQFTTPGSFRTVCPIPLLYCFVTEDFYHSKLFNPKPKPQVAEGGVAVYNFETAVLTITQCEVNIFNKWHRT